MTETLTITWTGPDGRTWDLTAGSEGVILDLDQRGLGWARIDHVYGGVGGTRIVASRVGRAELDLAVRLDDTLRGEDYYRLSSQWWESSNSPLADGVLSVARPGAPARTRRCRLRESPDTQWPYDPGLRGAERPAELWPLVSASPWWDGPEQVIAMQAGAQAAATTGTPFYGASGRGWPLYIGSPAVASGLVASNRGAGPMWPVWTLTGPLTRATVGVEGATLVYDGVLAAGEQVEIVTDPSRRQVVAVDGGESRWPLVTGQWAPIPRGERVPLVMGAEGVGPETTIVCSAAERFAAAW